MLLVQSAQCSSCRARFDQEVIVNQRDIAEISIHCAQIFLVVKRGTLGKSEADINPSILAATSNLTRYVVMRNM